MLPPPGSLIQGLARHASPRKALLVRRIKALDSPWSFKVRGSFPPCRRELLCGVKRGPLAQVPLRSSVRSEGDRSGGHYTGYRNNCHHYRSEGSLQ